MTPGLPSDPDDLSGPRNDPRTTLGPPLIRRSYEAHMVSSGGLMGMGFIEDAHGARHRRPQHFWR
eukprot:1483401-Karenia_brevis.AAC.1